MCKIEKKIRKMPKNAKNRGSFLPSPVPPLNKGTPNWPKITQHSAERSAEQGMFGLLLDKIHKLTRIFLFLPISSILILYRLKWSCKFFYVRFITKWLKSSFHSLHHVRIEFFLGTGMTPVPWILLGEWFVSDTKSLIGGIGSATFFLSALISLQVWLLHGQ